MKNQRMEKFMLEHRTISIDKEVKGQLTSLAKHYAVKRAQLATEILQAFLEEFGADSEKFFEFWQRRIRKN